MKMGNWKYQNSVRVALLLVYLGFGRVVSAQYMEFEWSDEFRYSNKNTGFFSNFIGTDFSNIYLLQSNIEGTHPYKNAKLMLVALSKNTLAEVGVLPLKGFSKNAGQAEEFKSLDYLTSLVSEGSVFVFWRKLINTDSTRMEEIYAQTFKANIEDGFKTGLPLKKVFSFEQSVDSQKSVFDPTMCLVLSNQASNLIVLGSEKYTKGQLEFQYITLNAQLSSSAPRKVALPQGSETLPGKFTSIYDLGNDGDLRIRSTVRYTIDELWDLPNKHAKTYPVLTVLNSETAQSTSIKLRGENKTITDFSYHTSGGKTRVLGFFGDLTKDTTGIDKQGIFYSDLDYHSKAESNVNYVYFEKSTLNRLFPKSRGRKKNSDVPSMEELLETRFDIEHISAMSDSSLVLFFTRKYNSIGSSSRSDMNGENIYLFKHSCEKNNVSAIRFTNKGEILWTGNLERSITYDGTDVADLRVVEKYGKFFVLFGNEMAELKPPNNKKKFQHLTEELEYATFDPTTGRGKKFTTPVNEPDTEKKDLRYLDPNSVVVLDDQFYFHKLKIRQHPLWTAANVFFPPSIYYSALTGNTKLGKADFTLMRVMEGKRPRKK